MQFLVLGLFFLFPCSSRAQTIILEAFGDSLTAGLLAHTNTTHHNELSDVSIILSDLTMFKLTKDRSYLLKHERPQSAWPQVLANLLSTKETQFEVRNYGLSGAQSNTLETQVIQAKAVSEAEPNIAFFFIGHNDLCHNTGSQEMLVSDYSTNFNKAISEWDRRHKGSKAYFMSIAEINRIYPLLDNHVWYEGDKGRYRCNENWERLFPYCISHYKKFQEKTLDSYLVPRIEAINHYLFAMAEEWKKKSTRNQYFHIEMDSRAEFKKNYFAVDCYHLSKDGQAFVTDQIIKQISWQY